jgi:hypothetical protein
MAVEVSENLGFLQGQTVLSNGSGVRIGPELELEVYIWQS